MIRKGLNFKAAPHLLHRPGDPERDFRADGGPVTAGYCVVVRRSQVEPDEKGVITWAQVQKAPSIPFSGHSRSNMLYGAKWRRQTRGKWFEVRTKPQLNPAQYKAAEADGDNNPEGWEQQFFDVYWTSTIYWVENGEVFTASQSTYTDPAIIPVEVVIGFIKRQGFCVRRDGEGFLREFGVESCSSVLVVSLGDDPEGVGKSLRVYHQDKVLYLDQNSGEPFVELVEKIQGLFPTKQSGS